MSQFTTPRRRVKRRYTRSAAEVRQLLVEAEGPLMRLCGGLIMFGQGQSDQTYYECLGVAQHIDRGVDALVRLIGAEARQ